MAIWYWLTDGMNDDLFSIRPWPYSAKDHGHIIVLTDGMHDYLFSIRPRPYGIVFTEGIHDDLFSIRIVIVYFI